jgi:hypothetical protein
MSEETATRTVEQIVEDVRAGNPLSSDDINLLIGVLARMDESLRVQNTVFSVFAESVSEMAHSLTASLLQRVGRNDTKTKRSAQKICDNHLEMLYQMVNELANNLFGLAPKPEQNSAPEPTNEA